MCRSSRWIEFQAVDRVMVGVCQAAMIPMFELRPDSIECLSEVRPSLRSVPWRAVQASCGAEPLSLGTKAAQSLLDRVIGGGQFQSAVKHLRCSRNSFQSDSTATSLTNMSYGYPCNDAVSHAR